MNKKLFIVACLTCVVTSLFAWSDGMNVQKVNYQGAASYESIIIQNDDLAANDWNTENMIVYAGQTDQTLLLGKYVLEVGDKCTIFTSNKTTSGCYFSFKSNAAYLNDKGDLVCLYIPETVTSTYVKGQLTDEYSWGNNTKHCASSYTYYK